jgi:hypothetical protein
VIAGEGGADAEAIHLAYLTPPHKRKGKGGRQPAADPRLDPGIDPKKARRILANRLSAARSKMKQKTHVEVSHLCTFPSFPCGNYNGSASMSRACLHDAQVDPASDLCLKAEFLALADLSSP